jgi:hypothetical protein
MERRWGNSLTKVCRIHGRGTDFLFPLLLSSFPSALFSYALFPINLASGCCFIGEVHDRPTGLMIVMTQKRVAET